MQGLGVTEFVLYITYRWSNNSVALAFLCKSAKLGKNDHVKVRLLQKLDIFFSTLLCHQ
jgi:hypothetical protein